jgi:autotransporter-associated beta strand protein
MTAAVRMVVPSLLRRHKAQLVATAAGLVLLSQPAFAIDVGTEADLRAAIETARTTPNTEIVLTANIALSQDLPALQGTGTIIRSSAGNTYSINGAGQYRGLFVYSGSVTVQNLTITNAVAQGGHGGAGVVAGGGGAGLGGALFVNAGASVTVSNVSLLTNQAVGGNGGQPGGFLGGGGGLGGDGGTAPSGVQSNAGGGGIGRGAVGGFRNQENGGPGIVTGAAGGGDSDQGTGGIDGGGGAGTFNNLSAVSGAAGGGVRGASGYYLDGKGHGGFGGGGAGNAAAAGGNGGFGGGGGANSYQPGGIGGFGGGGGGGFNTAGGTGGFGGGDGANDVNDRGGGGGAGMGGAIFVVDGGVLELQGALNINGNTVSGGSGGTASATGGQAFGSGIFLQGDGTLTFNPGAGNTQTINNVIADQTGSGGSGSYATGGPNCTDGVGCGSYNGAGSWGLNKTGAGTLVLNGNNTYSGGTNLNAGKLSVSKDTSLGDASGALNFNGGILQITGTTFGSTARSINWGASGGGFDIVEAAHSFAVSQILSGNGGLSKTGAGTLILNGNNSFTGGVTINGGTISAGHNNALGTGTFTVLGSTLDIQNGVTISNPADLKANLDIKVDAAETGTYAGNISSTGNFGVSKIGDGTLIMSGTNSYTGGTRVKSGFLQLGDDTKKGTIIGEVRVGAFGTLDVVNADTSGITRIRNNGEIYFLNRSDAGTAAITNHGVLYFVNRSSAANATIANNGFALFAHSTTAGNATITNNNGIGFVDTATAGNATITNNFFMGFAGSATAGNASITNKFALEFGENSTAGNATIVTRRFAATLFGNNADGGNARFVTHKNGEVDFSATRGPNGDGKISAGSIEGAGTYIIGGGNTLTVGSNNRSTEVSGIIANDCACLSDAASLVKVGTGTLTLSGKNTYKGTTDVKGGALLVNSSLVNSPLTTVHDGGTLGGNGTVGNTVIASGGTLAPGNSIGKLNVKGGLTFQNGATYFVELGGNGSADRTNVTGNAKLAGTVAAQVTGSLSRQYTILSAAGGLGGTTFSALDLINMPANFGLQLAYRNDTDVLLQLTAQLASGAGALTVNQQNVAHAINGYFNQGGTLPADFVKLFGLTGDPLRNALNQVSGEYGASVATSTFMAWNSLFNMIFDPFAQNRGGFGGGGASAFAAEPQSSEAVRLAYAAVSPKRDLKDAPITKAPVVPAASFAARWSVWGGGYGGTAKTDGNAQIGSHDTTSRAYGFAAGADYRFAPDTLVGFALAGGGTSFSLAQGLGSGRSDLFQASVYARQNWGAAYLMGAFGYGWQDFTLSRTVNIGNSGKLEADFNANSLAGRAEGGYRFGTPLAGVTPYGAVQVVSLDLPSFSERATNGSNAFALSYAGRSDTQTRSELGARFDYAMPMREALLTLRGRAAWAHDFDTDRVANPVFLALPGTAFTVFGAQPDADSLLVSAGAELGFANGFSIAGSFEGEFSGNTDSYAGKGTLRYRW